MSGLVFDSGPIISLTMNNLLWVLRDLKGKYSGEFIIPESVRVELIDRALETKKFKFEALQTQEFIRDKTLTVYKNAQVRHEAYRLMKLANSVFITKGTPVKIVHPGEIAVLAAAKKLGADAVVIDERNTRELVEHPEHIAQIMRHRLHDDVHIDRTILRQLRAELKGIKVIRSLELATIAFELGLLDRYINHDQKMKKTLLESVLWGMKLNGCAATEAEIGEVLRLEQL